MVTDVSQTIEVGAVFRRGEVRPVWFIWNSRKHSVQDISYRWQEQRGDNFYHLFQLVSDGGIYKVSLDSRSMAWNLEKIYNE
ncbi:MAG: hypothetical protein HY586_05310 [Candidatus Omnitrophica bacterium]|nr:hypothetical protein [Candidatus Omnitrophota bacterium]